jgi:hypothetical protein
MMNHFVCAASLAVCLGLAGCSSGPSEDAEQSTGELSSSLLETLYRIQDCPTVASGGQVGYAQSCVLGVVNPILNSGTLTSTQAQTIGGMLSCSLVCTSQQCGRETNCIDSAIVAICGTPPDNPLLDLPIIADERLPSRTGFELRAVVDAFSRAFDRQKAIETLQCPFVTNAGQVGLDVACVKGKATIRKMCPFPGHF